MSWPPFHRASLNILRQISLISVLLYSAATHARPDMTPLGPNIADKGSAYYHFTINTVDSADGKRHYKVWTAIPDAAPPADGYPVLYLLDGNTVMDRLSDTLLKPLMEKNPPVLVAIGYQTSLPFDLYARAWDDTPPANDSNTVTLHGRPGGGSLAFRQLIEKTIAPVAEQDLPVNAHQRGVWGHSLGGIFVLDTYLADGFFNRYYATSPSLSSAYIGMLSALEALPPQSRCAKQLTVLTGSGGRDNNPQAPAEDPARRIQDVVSVLNSHGNPAYFRSYPDLSHGQMFSVGFEQALRAITSPAVLRCQ